MPDPDSATVRPQQPPSAHPSARLVTLASGAVLGVLFLVLGAVASRVDDRRLDSDLAHEAHRLKTAYEVAQNDIEIQLLTVAGVIAAEPAVNRLLKDAATASANRNGSPDNNRVAGLRNELRRTVERSWNVLREQVGLREMQFVLPGSIAFLNLHAPGEFGDSLQEQRPLIRDVEITDQPHSGFETSRSFAGIRGAVPVFAPETADGRTSLLGVLEVGIAFEGGLRRLREGTGADFGVVLHTERLSRPLRERYRPRHAGADDASCCVLAATTGDELASWLAHTRLPEFRAEYGHTRLDWNGKTYQVVRFALRDYLARKDPAHPPVGSIVAWRDVTALLDANRSAKRSNWLFAAVGYGVALLLMMALVRWSSREWLRQLTAGIAENLRLSAQNRALLMAVGEGIYGVDRAGNTTFVNPAALDLLGFDAKDLVGQRAHPLFHHHRPDGTPYPVGECPVFLTLADGRRRECEEWFIRRNGEGVPVQLTVAPTLEGGRPNGAVVVFRDISELKQKADALLRMASTDSLTGLTNRRQFIDLLQSEMSRQQRAFRPLSLLMVDIDHFKRINDTYGHAAGDAALKHFATVAQRGLRTVDSIGRIGGEEFAILLPDSTAAQGVIAGERLRAACAAEPACFEEQPIPLTVSVGVTVVTPQDIQPDLPLRRADEAMYQAKSEGRNRVVLFGDPAAPGSAG